MIEPAVLISEAWQHRRQLFVKALRETRDRDIADDMVAETYAKALANAKTYRPDGKLMAWMYRILMNTILDWRRRSMRRKRLADMVPIDAYETIDHFSSAHLVDARYAPRLEDPQHRQDAEFGAAMIWSCLHQLPACYREPLLKRHEGKSYQTISEEMNRTTGTIKSRICRGKRHLRTILRESGV